MPEITPAQKYLYGWECRIDSMGFFPMPKGYKSSIHRNKYSRFTGYIKEDVINFFKKPSIDSISLKFNIDRDSFPENWWDIAIKIANGKEIENTIPRIENTSEKIKNVVYEKYIPAYRVLKESFDARPWYHWITQHSQYTAERDTLKALSVLITSVMGDTQADIDTALAKHKENVPTSGIPAETRKAFIEQTKTHRISHITLERDKQSEIKEAKIFGSNDEYMRELISAYNEFSLALNIMQTGNFFTDSVIEDMEPSDSERLEELISKIDFMENSNETSDEHLIADEAVDDDLIFTDEKQNVIIEDIKFENLDESYEIQPPAVQNTKSNDKGIEK